jgi:hypothetical protein
MNNINFGVKFLNLPEFGAQIVILGNDVQNVTKGRLGGVARRFRRCRSWCRVDDQGRQFTLRGELIKTQTQKSYVRSRMVI